MSNDPDEQEETLWRNDIKKGWLRKKVVYSRSTSRSPFMTSPNDVI
jgi:hypothetical protein